MGGSVSALIDISRRSLQNQSKALQVIGNNVANVNTEGYSRREVVFVDKTSQDASAASAGLGADIKEITRRVDEYVSSQLRTTTSDESGAEVRDSLLARLEEPFRVDKSLRHIGYELTNFFNALNDLQANPADLALRAQMIDTGQSLTQAIRLTYDSLSSVQREADDRIRSSVNDINNATTKIAELNLQIAGSEASGQKNLGLRDSRDQVLIELSKKISFTALEDSAGSVSVTLANGFGLVSGGISKTLETTTNPSFGGNRRAMDDGLLSAVVWDADSTATASHVDLSNLIAAGGGEVAGLLNTRGIPPVGAADNFYSVVGDIPQIGARIEAIAQTLITTFNRTYRPTDTVTPAVVMSRDLNGSPPPVYGLFNVNSGAALSDLDLNGIESPADITASGRRNFGSVISFVPTDARALALSKDEDGLANNGLTTFSQGNGGIATDLFNLRTAPVNLVLGTYNTGGQTLEDIYNQTVSYVGGIKSASASSLELYTDKNRQMEELKNSISGVSMDEELSKLISFQKTFQASSRLIRIGSDLLDTVLQAVS